MSTDCAVIQEMFDRAVEPITLFQQHCRKEVEVIYSFIDIAFDPTEGRKALSDLQVFEI